MLLAAGYRTHFIGGVTATIEIWLAVFGQGDPLIRILLATFAAGLALLGPGACPRTPGLLAGGESRSHDSTHKNLRRSSKGNGLVTIGRIHSLDLGLLGAVEIDENRKCLMSMAERQLESLMSVLTNLYGSEQARISAEDWIDEFESMDAPPESSAREWRVITIAAASRLASRLREMGSEPEFEPLGISWGAMRR